MRPFYVALTTVVHGLFAEMALVVLADTLSPTFNITGVPDLSGSQAAVWIVLALTTSFALGVVIHTISRGLFHSQKQQWALDVLASAAVRNRLAAVGGTHAAPGSPSYDDIAADESPNRVKKAAAFMHSMEYQVMARSPFVFETIQLYRDQYRMARGFVIPCVLFAIALPFWEPLAAIDRLGGVIVPFPIIRSQAFMLSILAAIAAYWAFRERAYRYAAAKTQAWVTLEAEAREDAGYLPAHESGSE